MVSKLRVFMQMIKFEHTIFALPFAYQSAFLAAGGAPTWGEFFWLTLAMIGARTSAMSLNRLIDREIDALNPRTKERALPLGLLSTTEVWIYTSLSFLLLYMAANQLNQLCVRLMPIAVLVLVVYSYTKRWTWACHLILGVADGLAPLGAWVAITGSIDLPGVLLGLAMAAWVAGFDIIYACQDLEFDREHRLYSIPASFGLPRALLVSRLLHVVAVLLLLVVGLVINLKFWYWSGILLATGLLIKEHRLVSPRDLSKVGVAFLNMNGYLSMVVFVFSLLDIFLRN